MFIKLHEEGLELHPLIVRRFKQSAAICISGLPVVVSSSVSQCPNNNACEGWQWIFTHFYDVGSTSRSFTFSVHRAAIGVPGALVVTFETILH